MKNESLAKRIQVAIDAEGIEHLTDDERQNLVSGVISELQPELDKLRAAHREHGRVSTRLYLARLELKEAQSRLRRMVRNTNSGAQHWQRILRLLRDLMHAVDPNLLDGPLDKDLEHCLRLAQDHRHQAIAQRSSDVKTQNKGAADTQ